MRIMTCITLAIAAVLTAGECQAEFVVAYDLAGEPGNQESTAPGETAANVTGLHVTRGPGLGATSAGNSISSNGWNTLDATRDYFSFGFTVDPGYFATLDQLRIGTRSSNTGPGQLGLFFSGDGFTTNLFTFAQNGTSFLNSEVDLSSLSNVTGDAEFRIIALDDTRADGTTGITSTGTFRITNLFGPDGDTGSFGITGTVTAVPEPSSMALLGLVAVGGVVLRRRQRRPTNRPVLAN